MINLSLTARSSRRALAYAFLAAVVSTGLSGSAFSAIETIDLIYEFDGNSNSGTTSFGTIKLEDNGGGGVDFTITANTTNLGGGDIQELYFNVPDSLGSATVASWTISNVGGTSNGAIDDGFSIIGPGPSVKGGGGASFEWGINFGNGGGNGGNGTLTVATFNLNNTSGLTVNDLLAAELSDPNNTPPVLMAVHFQETNVFGATSETVGGPGGGGGGGGVIPEPMSLVVWGLLVSCVGCVALRRRRTS